MANKIKILCLALFLTMFATAPLMAVSSGEFEVNTDKDFEKGEFVNVALQSDGKLKLGPVYNEIADLEEPYVWSLAASTSGDIFAGTGDEGKVYKIDKKGNKTIFFDTDDLEVLSLLVDKKDNLYIGTGPEGTLYKINKDGNLLWKKEVEATYIWNMAKDSKGNIFLGTGGDGGKIFKLSPRGEEITLFVNLPEDNITALSVGDGDILYAGTNPSGQIYEISPQKTIKVLYDTDYEEIRSFAMDADGNLFASANSTKRRIAPKPPMKAAPPKEGETGEEMGGKITDIGPQQAQMLFEEMTGGQPPSKLECAVYKLSPDGLVTKIWKRNGLQIYSLDLDDRGSPIVGTGSKGLIFKLLENNRDVAIIKVEESEILSLLKRRGAFLFTTGNNGKIYEFKGKFSKSGAYISQVFDTKFPMSRFGVIQADLNTPRGTDIKISYRVGDTEEPGDFWSEWSKEFDADSAFKVDDRARYIQFKATLLTNDTRKTPDLNSVNISYIQKNYPPRILGIVFDSEGKKSKNAKGASGAGPEFSYPKGMESASKMASRDLPKFERDNIKPSAKKLKRKIQWKVKDPNKDKLTYTLFFKGEEEENWKLFKEDLTSTSTFIDITSLPDGKYRVKLIASDKRSNGENLGYETEMISEPFLVDNTAPDLTLQKAEPPKSLRNKGAKGYTIKVRIKDQMSTIREVRYSKNASEWHYLVPDDGLYDSKEESGTIVISFQERNEVITIMVKAADQAGNIASAGLTLR